MRSTLFMACAFVALAMLAQSQTPSQPVKLPSIADLIDDAIAGKRASKDVRLDAVWTEDGKTSSVTIHSDGLSIHWQGKQFRMSAEQRIDLLRQLKAAKFAAMPAEVGVLSKGSPPEPYKPNRPSGSISLRIGSESKFVRHGDEGPLDENFIRLVKDLLKACIDKSATGIGVDSLADGLQKVRTGKLDPRALKIEIGYLRSIEFHNLKIEGFEATISGNEDVGEPFEGQRTLSPRELTRFIELLESSKFRELPKQVKLLFDLSAHIEVRVLDKQHKTWGYGYLEAVTSQEHLDRFEALWDATYEFHPKHKPRKFRDPEPQENE